MNHLNGWDTVYAVSINETNEALSKALTNTTFDLPSSDLKLSGTFGAWSIVTGGASTLLHLETQVTKGTFNLPGVADNVDLSGVSFVFEISLQLLPSKTNPTQHDLSFNAQTISSVTSTTTTPLVTPVLTIDPQNKLSESIKRSLVPLMAVAINNQAASVGYVFANINLVKPGTGSWLTPVQADYAYLELQSTPQQGYLCILAVTDNRDISAYKRIVDPSIISGQNNAGFFISQELFLKNVIMPQLPADFKASSAKFQLVGDTIQLDNCEFSLPDVTIPVLLIPTTYHPKCLAVSITTKANTRTDHLSVYCFMYGEIFNDGGIKAMIEIDLEYKTVFDPNAQTISFSINSTPKTSNTVEYPGDATGKAIMQGTVDTVVKSILSWIKLSLAVDICKFNIVNMHPIDVHWSGIGNITITDAGLNDYFFMSGQIKTLMDQNDVKLKNSLSQIMSEISNIRPTLGHYGTGIECKTDHDSIILIQLLTRADSIIKQIDDLEKSANLPSSTIDDKKTLAKIHSTLPFS
ncbi:TULIP family P47-like protein [Nitrosopumilus sp.]|uniref:TULIP family P47-like protein n=1 Tax=Nitrosopumilus sp. TaxID=2024843 RepID=UPI002633CF81|nr:TULIP family P47-like protein [Nitrosopumilus sp.]